VGRSKNSLALVVTVVALVAYAVFVWQMWGKADGQNNEVEWSRLVGLLTGVEAIVFAAVGWLFGREVNRAQAEQAATAQKEAGEAKGAGQALRTMIAAKAESGGARDALGETGSRKRDADLEELLRVAEQHFPPSR
jgi:type VI protein secretion system component VasK